MSLRIVAALLCTLIALASSSARPDDLALIDRPVTLPAGASEATLRGELSSWGGQEDDFNGNALTGETVALGFDHGITDRLQLGLAAALPINPGPDFGSVVGNVSFALRKDTAIRLDLGYERLNFSDSVTINGMTTNNTAYQGAFFAGLGAYQAWRLGSMVSLVSGRNSDAINFGEFTNIGADGGGIYAGASSFPNNSADLISVATGTTSGSGTVIDLNFPIGILVQPDPHFAITLRTGYSASLQIPSNGSTVVDHMIPLNLDITVSPSKQFDLGASFGLAGFVASSADNTPGYTDIKNASVWLRWRG